LRTIDNQNNTLIMPARKTTIVCRLLLEREGQYLFLSQTSKNGGKLSLVGGKVDAGELVLHALIRESLEEIGIFLEAQHLELTHVLQREKSNETMVVMYFRANEWYGEPASREVKKFTHVEWHSIENLPPNISPITKKVLRNHIKGISFTTFDERRVSILM
jgi:8-oxo-dGTP diphosphatase